MSTTKQRSIFMSPARHKTLLSKDHTNNKHMATLPLHQDYCASHSDKWPISGSTANRLRRYLYSVRHDPAGCNPLDRVNPQPLSS